MSNESPTDGQWNQRSNAPVFDPGHGGSMFQLLFERSADAIWLFDPQEGIFIDCNPAAVALMRCGTKEKLLCSQPADLSPARQPDGRLSAEAAAEVTALVATSGAHRFEWLARRLDGTEVPLEIIATAIQARDRPLHVVVSRDISERKQAEAALRESEELLSSTTDHLSEAIYRTGPDHELVFVNRAYLQMFGYASLEEVRGVPRERLYANPDDRRMLLEKLAGEGRFREEIEFVRKDGSRFWGLTSSVAIADGKSGQIGYHVGSISDVTERKKAEAEVRQLNATLERRVADRTAELAGSEARLRTLVEHAPEAIVVFDGDTGRFLMCNENAVQLYGLSRERLMQLGPWDVSPERQPDGRDSSDVAREWIQKAVNGEAPVFEWMHRHSSGREVPCEVRLVRLPSEGRTLVRGSVTDNTRRKRREKIQRATYEIAEAVHAAEDLESLYEHIHGIIQGLMPAGNFYIALFDPDTELISFPYFVDERSDQPAPFRLNTGLTGYVLRSGRALLVDAAMNARKKQAGDAVTFEGYEEIRYVESGAPAAIWLGVPLSVQGEPFGVMAVQDYVNPGAYGEEEKQILTFVATQTALAIDRKRAEQALRESEQKFRALFEASSQGVMLHDEEKFLEVNPATVRILGLKSADEIVGKHPGETSPPRQPDGESSAVAARRHIGECMARGSARFEWTAQNPDGKLVPIEVILTRIQMEGRHIIQAVINDISERKQAEAELKASEARLRESEARFSAAFHAGPVCITMARVDDGRFVEVNEAFLQWVGLARREVIGRTSVDLELWSDAAARDAFWKELHEHRSVRNRECQLRTQTNGARVMLLSADLIEIHKQPHVLTIGLDITDRKMAEAELLKALGREKELSQLKSSFVSMVSHEFRTPLGIIMSSAEILQDYLERLDSEERQHHLGSIAKNTKRMAEMMEEVLVLGRLDAGKMDFQPAPIDLRAFAARLVDEVMSATEQRCAIRLAPGYLPAPAEADERLLRHIFTNLLSNAVKYSEAGKEVVFALEAQGSEAVCQIRDQGIGIPEADQSWLFNAFHRGRNVGPRPGTGLGLVIVKRCVELHGGELRVDSKPGEGTTVTVRLPLFTSIPSPTLA